MIRPEQIELDGAPNIGCKASRRRIALRLKREPDFAGRAGAEASAGGKQVISRFARLLKNGKYLLGLEWILLIAFVALASSMLFLGVGSITAR